MIALLLRCIIAMGFAFAPASLNAHGYTRGDIKVIHPWSRATPAGAKVGGGYLKIRNEGSEADRLLGGDSDVATRVEIHETTVVEGVARMRPLVEGVVIPPGGEADLKPGGAHLMLIELKQPLRQGQSVKATLRFERAGAVDIDLQIDAIGAQPPAISGYDNH